jgi:hypothetical protein
MTTITSTSTSTVDRLLDAYIVGDEDFVEYSCEGCAKDYAEKHGLEWYNGSTEEHESGRYAYAVLFHDGETDTPMSCYCGQYLDVALTSDGEDYMRENDFPEWLYEAHGVTR